MHHAPVVVERDAVKSDRGFAIIALGKSGHVIKSDFGIGVPAVLRL